MSSGSSDSDESSADGSTEATSDATGSSSGADTGDILPCVDEILTAPSIIQSTTLAAGDDEASDCGGAGSEDLVYQLTADVAGFYSFDTTGSVLDTLLYATRGTCTSPIEWCSDDVDPDTNSYQSHIGMYAEAGQRMLVMVDGASGESGSFSLSVGVEPGPCTVTNAMPSVPSVTSWTTTGASDRTSASCGGGGAPDLRFLWVAPADGTYAISTMGATFDTLLYVLDGVCGEELGCNDDDGSGGTTSQVTLDLVAGQTITAVIDGWGAMSGDFSLHIDAVMAHE